MKIFLQNDQSTHQEPINYDTSLDQTIDDIEHPSGMQNSSEDTHEREFDDDLFAGLNQVELNG